MFRCVIHHPEEELHIMVYFVLYNTSYVTTLKTADGFMQEYEILPEDGV